MEFLLSLFLVLSDGFFKNKQEDFFYFEFLWSLWLEVYDLNYIIYFVESYEEKFEEKE